MEILVIIILSIYILRVSFLFLNPRIDLWFRGICSFNMLPVLYCVLFVDKKTCKRNIGKYFFVVCNVFLSFVRNKFVFSQRF